MSKNYKLDAINSKKVAIYIRVSTSHQVDKDSLPVQRMELINYAKYALNIENVEVFEDAGYSGKNTMRPAFQRMMTKIRNGEFSHILVWKIDRISRNLLDFASMYSELKRLGVVFISKNEQFDTGSAMGEAMLKIILIFAELERNMTSERVTSVMISRAGTGQWNGGRVPFGYSWDSESKEFSIIEKEADIVQIIFEMYSEGNSLLNIAKYLNEKQIFTRNNKPWSSTTLHIILNNPFYCGSYRYNRHDYKGSKKYKDKEDWILIENHHIPIIDTELFNICQNKLRSKAYGKGLRNYSHVHIFSNLLICGECGSKFIADVDKPRSSGWRPSIYSCSRRRRFNDCKNKYISDATLGPFVLNYIFNIFKAYSSFGESTSIEVFEKKLLRGPYLEDVEAIEPTGLIEMYNSFKGYHNEDIFAPSIITENINVEKDILLNEKRRQERALSRLKSLFLYDDATLSETEFLKEQKIITDNINKIEEDLKQFESQDISFELNDEEFIKKASYFILSNELQNQRTVNYKKLLKNLDHKILQQFIHSLVQNFCIKDGKVTEICFKNGITQHFLYKDK